MNVTDMDYIVKAKEIAIEYASRDRLAATVKLDSFDVLSCNWTRKHWTVQLAVKFQPGLRYEITHDTNEAVTMIRAYMLIDSVTTIEET
jgi:hypothetical protein